MPRVHVPLRATLRLRFQALWLVVALASAAHANEPRSLSLAGYLELGSRYRAGDADGAVGELLTYPTGDVDAAVGALARSGRRLHACADGPESIETATVESLVLMHLDALRRIDSNTTARPLALRHEADTAASVLEWLERASAGWHAAAKGAPTGCVPRARIARREFYFTLAGFLLSRGQPVDALRAARKGLEETTPELFPDLFPDPNLYDDPWWLYPFGTWPAAERLFDVLRRRVAEP